MFLLAAGLRAYDIGTTSLWTDELFTRFYPKLGLGFMWTEGMRLEPNPPLYYSLISLWERVAGDSAFALRLPSMIGSLLALGLTMRLGAELFERRASVVFAALLLAFSATSIAYAQEARAYALQGAALALALLGFARLLRGPVSLGALAAYAIGATLAIYLHLTSVLAVAAFGLVGLFSAVGRRPLLDRAGLLRFVAANVVVALACLPLVPVILAGSSGTATDWIPSLDRYSLERALGMTLFGPALTTQAPALFEIAAVLLAVLLLIPPWRPGRRALTVLVAVPGLFLLLMIVGSVKKPLLLDRTLAWLWIPFALVLGDVMARRVKVIAAFMLCIAVFVLAVHLKNIAHTREDWRDFLARLPGLGPPALVVLAPHTSPASLAVYAPDAATPVRLNGDFPPIVETTVIPAMFHTQTIDLSEMKAAIASGRPVWLIVRRPDVDWMQKAIADLPPPKMTVQDGDGSNPAIRALRW